MEIVSRERNSVCVRMSLQEVWAVNNALNEVCNGIDVPEFETRMGVSMQQAEALLFNIQQVLGKLEKGEDCS